MRQTHGNAVCVLLADALSFRLALLEGMLVLELGSHDVGGNLSVLLQVFVKLAMCLPII